MNVQMEVITVIPLHVLILMVPTAVSVLPALLEMVSRALPVRWELQVQKAVKPCLLYTSPSPRDVEESRMPSSA